MKTAVKTLLLSIFLLNFFVGTALAETKSELNYLIGESTYVLDDWAKKGQMPLPEHLMGEATGIVVIPAMVKGGFIFAGTSGDGIVSLKDRVSGKWSAPAFINITGGSIGFQAGVEKIDLVLVVVGRNAAKLFLDKSFKLGADISIAAANEGFQKEYGMDYKLDSGIYSVSKSRGFFAGVALKGAMMNIDEDANKTYYGNDVTIDDILLMHEVRKSKQVQRFEKVLRDFMMDSFFP